MVRSARVALRIDASAAGNEVGRNIAIASANQILRFCPNLSLIGGDEQLLTAAQDLGMRIHGTSCEVTETSDSELAEHACVLNVGSEAREGRWVTINSKGWLARLAIGTEIELPTMGVTRNAIGEVAAACRGVAEVFKLVIGLSPEPGVSELCLHSFRQGPPGELSPGPKLPLQPLEVEAFLIGCGAVMNGWAYVVAQLPVQGYAEAVDKQSLRPENIGPYVASDLAFLGRSKSELIADVLAPDVEVKARTDEFEFFKVRLEHGLLVPPLIINGLDNPETRRSVQRLWPATLIDMAAGGLSSQVIVKQAGTRGQCILDAFSSPDGDDYADELSREVGVPADAIRQNPTGIITDEMVKVAPENLKPALREAKRRGQRICGRVMEHNLVEERDNPDFAPAVPFATCFSGVVAAAETVKVLLGQTYDPSAHYQYSFQSRRGRLLQTSCQPGCECQGQPAA